MFPLLSIQEVERDEEVVVTSRSAELGDSRIFSFNIQLSREEAKFTTLWGAILPRPKHHHYVVALTLGAERP